MKDVVETDTHFILALREPFWGGWKKYGWTKGVEGIGINEKLVDLAISQFKRILVKYKYGDYEITGTKAKREAEKYKSYYVARDNTRLYVIPRTAFYRMPTEADNDVSTGTSEKTVIVKPVEEQLRCVI